MELRSGTFWRHMNAPRTWRLPPQHPIVISALPTVIRTPYVLRHRVIESN